MLCASGQPSGGRDAPLSDAKSGKSGVTPIPDASAPLGSSYAAGHFLAEKAGMAGVDKARVAKVVEEASKGSKYYNNAQAREAALTKKITAMKEALAKVSSKELAAYTAAMEAYAVKVEAERSLSQVCVVCDMDQFFAAVAIRKDPSLAKVPFAVGGMSMISTASYEARKYGVRSAMPGFIAVKLCPQLVFVKLDFSAYVEAAKDTREIFALYDEHFSAGSLDEAFMDFTPYCERNGIYRPETGLLPTSEQQQKIAATVNEMRAKVTEHTKGLTCSAGIAANFMLAKMASNENKPDGQMLIPFDRESIMTYVAAQPVRKIPGVGKVTEKILVELGVNTCADILAHKGMLRAVFTERMARWLVRCALGIGTDDLVGWASPTEDEKSGLGRKSISQERTFGDTSDTELLCNKCRELAADVSRQMVEEGIKAKTITIKLKLHTYEVRQRSVTLSKATNAVDAVQQAALQLLRAEFPLTLRLLGVRASALEKATSKLTVLDKFVTTASTDTAAANVGNSVDSGDDDVVLIGHAVAPPAKRKRLLNDFFAAPDTQPPTHKLDHDNPDATANTSKSSPPTTTADNSIIVIDADEDSEGFEERQGWSSEATEWND